ncbi:hypothetical protein [Streptomyces sp. NPDC050560]|uniref:hypothetical protein n=1 Tax=Streptomyces sp. NPDC050560 TaxID=3365630 RepID=UPI0037B0D4F0
MAGLVSCAAGCSGDGAAEQGSGTVGGSAETVRAAAAVLVEQGTSKARTAMEMASGGTRVTIRGEGVYDYRARTGRLKVLLPPDPGGTEEHRPITELLAPGALYMKHRGAGVPDDKWVRVDTASLTDGNLVTGGATDPLTAAQILRGAGQVTYVGSVDLAGVRVRHFRGVADLGSAARAVGEGSGGASLAAAAKGFSRTRVPFDVYLDGDGRIRKLRHRFSYDNGEGARPVEVTSVVLLYDFGAGAEVALPEAAEIYTGRVQGP